MGSFRWRVVLVVLIVAGASALVLTRDVRLGLDLRGGTQVVLEAQDTEEVEVTDDTAARILEVLRRRVDALGVSEPTLQRQGDRRVIVELPGLEDPEQALEVIGRTAQLAFHPVLSAELAGVSTTTPSTIPGEERIVLPDEDGLTNLVLGPPAVIGDAVGSARAAIEPTVGAWRVEVDFRGEGDDQWAALTGQAACASPGSPMRRIAIVLDQEVISSPGVADEIACGEGITGGSTVITGTFTESEAKELALLIRAGALPAPVEVVRQQTIGPTLGDAAIDASVSAAIVGVMLTMLFLIAYYRLFGFLAMIALSAYGLISFAVLLALEATLTLPGIAGFVLAIGMAVDANVLVFERTKDEHEAGRNPRSAARNGFRGAWSAIADSNATTLIAAILLFIFASGAVKGFGITLAIGVVVSMFTALVVTRVLVEFVLRRAAVAARPHLCGFHVGHRFREWLATRNPDLLGHSKRWLLLSAVLVVLAAGAVAGPGLNYGLDFSGGRVIEYRTDRPVDPDDLRPILNDIGLPRAIVQSASGEGPSRDNISVRSADLGEEEKDALEEELARLGGSPTIIFDDFVGPKVGDELKRRALTALALALVAQLSYLAIRFRWTFGTAAVAAMFHDAAVLLGIFAILGKTIDEVFLASLLTVIGYSINDSVVVFDRVREQRRARAKEPLTVVANDACLQTIPRTVNTGLGALFILVPLYFFGGDTLTDFALALIIGIVVGTYSSVFVAAPVALTLEHWRPATTVATPGAPPPAVRARAKARTGARGGPSEKDKTEKGEAKPDKAEAEPDTEGAPAAAPRGRGGGSGRSGGGGGGGGGTRSKAGGKGKGSGGRQKRGGRNTKGGGARRPGR